MLLDSGNPHIGLIARFQNKAILPLDLRPKGFLHFRQNARSVVLDGKDRIVVTHSHYAFSLSDDPDDKDKWVFRHEYDRDDQNEALHAHFHINGVHSTIDSIDYRRMYIPTGRLSIEQILMHLIIEYKIETVSSDALEYLAESHREFMRRRTDWSDPAIAALS